MILRLGSLLVDSATTRFIRANDMEGPLSIKHPASFRALLGVVLCLVDSNAFSLVRT